MKKKPKLKKINIPPGINTWEVLQEEAKTNPAVGHLVRAMEDTFAYFRVPEVDRLRLGDFIQRFSMMQAINEGPIAIDTQDDGVHALIDMVEWFSKRADFLLGDSPHDPADPRRN